MKYCKECGAEIKEGSLFCVKCGMKLEHKEVSETESVLDNKTKSKQKITIIIVAIVVAVVLLAIGIVGGFCVVNMRNRDNEVDSEISEDIEYEEDELEEYEVEDELIEAESEEVDTGDTDAEETELMWDYAMISEKFVGSSSIMKHTVGFETGTVRYFYAEDDPMQFYESWIQEYDGNPETIFMFEPFRCYRYGDIVSFDGTTVVVYNTETNTEDKIEYIDKDTIRIQAGESDYIYNMKEVYCPTGVILSEDEIADEVEIVRDWYYTTQDKIANGEYVECPGEHTYYKDEESGLFRKAVFPAGLGGMDYTREYYYGDEHWYMPYFIFAFNQEGDEYRIYIKPDDTYVIRYIENDTIYEMGDTIPNELEVLKDYFVSEAFNALPY